MDEGIPDAFDGLRVKLCLLTDPVPAVYETAERSASSGVKPAGYALGHVVAVTPTAVAITFRTNKARKVNTTVSLTALPTPCGPPLTWRPL